MPNVPCHSDSLPEPFRIVTTTCHTSCNLPLLLGVAPLVRGGAAYILHCSTLWYLLPPLATVLAVCKVIVIYKCPESTATETTTYMQFLDTNVQIHPVNTEGPSQRDKKQCRNCPSGTYHLDERRALEEH